MVGLSWYHLIYTTLMDQATIFLSNDVLDLIINYMMVPLSHYMQLVIVFFLKSLQVALFVAQ